MLLLIRIKDIDTDAKTDEKLMLKLILNAKVQNLPILTLILKLIQRMKLKLLLIRLKDTDTDAKNDAKLMLKLILNA